jgi:hypothetical protein
MLKSILEEYEWNAMIGPNGGVFVNSDTPGYMDARSILPRCMTPSYASWSLELLNRQFVVLLPNIQANLTRTIDIV